jgi:hypothetical protein
MLARESIPMASELVLFRWRELSNEVRDVLQLLHPESASHSASLLVSKNTAA